MRGRSPDTPRMVASLAAVALTVTAVLWITMAPGVGSRRSTPDLSAHQRRF